MANIPLKGSDRVVMPGAKVLAPADPTERLEVTVLVRRRAGEELRSRAAALASGKSAAAPLSREEFSARHGADPADLAAVRAFAAAHGLAVVLENAARRTVILSGTVAQFNAAFQQLQQNRFTDMVAVAYEHGYADQSHLIRAFKEFTNHSPSEFQIENMVANGEHNGTNETGEHDNRAMPVNVAR